MSIGRNVRFLRELHGMSQSDLAERLGKTQASINQLETGHTQKPRYTKALANIFGVTEMELRFSDMSSMGSGSEFTQDDFSMRLIEMRTEKGLQREEFAKKIGVSIDFFN
ncbi:MAG: helix-turn-helix transcriptional regulator [Cardiobacteriaceae bacterium]|nr:helix-turn-helix transcriptional regulator [Cardiobacteriaceae bacterium]